MSQKQEDLTKDLEQNIRELGAKMNIKLYELQRTNKQLNEALQNGDFSKIRVHLNTMGSSMNQIEGWHHEMKGFQRMGTILLKHINK